MHKSDFTTNASANTTATTAAKTTTAVTSVKKDLARLATTAAAAAGLVAAPLMSGPAANAATVEQWDQVAACESGGDWQINTGNGYQGGLQFSPETWAGHGGTQYAPSADQATKEQQIEIAENVLASQGAGAWPNCGGPVAG